MHDVYSLKLIRSYIKVYPSYDGNEVVTISVNHKRSKSVAWVCSVLDIKDHHVSFITIVSWNSTKAGIMLYDVQMLNR